MLDAIKKARGRHLPRSPVALAIGYVPDREAVFTRYIDSSHLEIDSNACERSLRVVAVGRKNRQFAGSRFGGEAAAASFSLIGSAKLHEIEPWAYLTDVTTRLAHLGDSPSDEDLTPLLPDWWIAAIPRARLPVGREPREQPVAGIERQRRLSNAYRRCTGVDYFSTTPEMPHGIVGKF